MDLHGKSAIVTGGARGIGFAVAEALLREGARAAICSRSEASLARALQALEPQGEIYGRVCNVGRCEEVEEFFQYCDEKLGSPAVLVNNAGVGAFAPVDELGLDDWRNVIDTNLSGPFYFTRLAAPRMKRRGGGFILNIGSLAGKHSFASGAAYNASKFGLNGFTEAAMLDLRRDNIRVAQIMPGSVQTEFSATIEGADWKLDPAAIAAAAVHLMRMPERNLASRVEMRPSRPPRK